MGTWEHHWECRWERHWERVGPYGNVVGGTCVVGESCIWEQIMLAILTYMHATIT
jgi:hypothetical protein